MDILVSKVTLGKKFKLLRDHMKKITTQEYFDILRGYYQNKKYHPKGGKEVNLKDLLNQIGFKELKDFIIWYKSLTQNDIKNGKKDWCTGHCCQSILQRLLKLSKIV